MIDAEQPRGHVTAASVEKELADMEADYKANRESLAAQYKERRKKLRALLAVLVSE